MQEVERRMLSWGWKRWGLGERAGGWGLFKTSSRLGSQVQGGGDTGLCLCCERICERLLGHVEFAHKEFYVRFFFVCRGLPSVFA